MLKKLLLTVFPFLAAPCDRSHEAPGAVTMMDPNDILFSLATLCDPIPAVEPGTLAADHRRLLEDDWRQIEFVAAANRSYIDSKLTELVAFRDVHRKGLGFTKLFVRPEHPAPLAGLQLVAGELAPGRQASLVLGEELVPGGFFVADASGWFIYGQEAGDGRLAHLAVSPSDQPVSAAFCRLLSTIAASGLFLVDWYACAVVDASSPEAVEMWTRGHR